MTDNVHFEFVQNVEAKMKTFTEERKETFSTKLSEQLEALSGKLDSRQQQQLQRLSVPHVVDDVSQAVVNNVIIKVKAWAELAAALPLSVLTPEVRIQVVGNHENVGKGSKRHQESRDIDKERIRNVLTDLIGATYTTRIAQSILKALSVDQSRQTCDDTELRSLVSRAALAASPVEPQFDEFGARKRILAEIGIAILVVEGLIVLAEKVDELIDVIDGW